MGDHPLVPDYDGPCLNNVVPALLDGTLEPPSWMPAAALEASQVVLLVLDGLGWEQLQDRRHLAPTLADMEGGPITSVVPSTTATALTSIATGLSPAAHGVVGYRVAVGGDVLNVLRWSTPDGDARRRIDPIAFQPTPAFLGHRPPIVTKAEFLSSGFSGAHLADVRFHGYRMPSTLVTEVRQLARAGEPFTYAYYEGIDKVAHEYGLGAHYDAELRAADRLAADLLEVLPAGAALVVTADHGQVELGDRVLPLHDEVLAHVAYQSGEGRFRWLHARPGRTAALHASALAHHGDDAWVVTAEETIDADWWGGPFVDGARDRLGDVALVARTDVSFHDPADTGPFELVGRHGSLTPAEMLVPVLVGRV